MPRNKRSVCGCLWCISFLYIGLLDLWAQPKAGTHTSPTHHLAIFEFHAAFCRKCTSVHPHMTLYNSTYIYICMSMYMFILYMSLYILHSHQKSPRNVPPGTSDHENRAMHLKRLIEVWHLKDPYLRWWFFSTNWTWKICTFVKLDHFCKDRGET